MTIAIVGGSGFLGTHLMQHLLTTTSYNLRIISRSASNLRFDPQYRSRVKLLDGNVLDEEQMTQYLVGADVAYYFVHMMGQANKDFYGQEAVAAHRFCASVRTAGVQRVVYMGGLGNDREQLSKHLASRHNTGTILRENLSSVIEFRASMIVGPGSVSFDIIKNLVHKLPFMTLPRWSNTLTQPIALSDALLYLSQAATLRLDHSEIVEIGGPQTMSYKALYRLYANWSGRHPALIVVPFLPAWLGGWWLNLFTPPNHARIGQVMVESLGNAMVVTHDRAQQLFPSIKPVPIINAFGVASLDKS